MFNSDEITEYKIESLLVNSNSLRTNLKLLS